MSASNLLVAKGGNPASHNIPALIKLIKPTVF